MIKILLISLLAALAPQPKEESMKELSDRVFRTAEKQFTELEKALPEDKMPVTFEETLKLGSLRTWTSGFFPGSLWYVYEYTGNRDILALARKETMKLRDICSMKTHHDIGFQVNSSFGNGYRLTGDRDYLEVMRNAAAKLRGRFNPKVGCIKSWDSHRGYAFPVIIDNMMNLELLLNTYNILGGDSLKIVACRHADTTLRNHFREDGSSYHVLAYDPGTGDIIKKMTAQGFCDESAWSRGCAWSLYGYTMMYRQTRDSRYLEAAVKIAAFIIPFLPEDGIPEWDFNAPGTKHAMGMDDAGAPKPEKFIYREGFPVERDASAGAIIASALLELSSYTDGDRSGLYFSTAEHILRSLASPRYFAENGNGGFLLKHCVTNLHSGKGVDIPLTYADYYFLEALLRYRHLSSAPSGKRVMARHVPERADDFVFENDIIAGRIYGKNLEHETLSPGIDIWVKIPGELIADRMYASRLSYHKFNGRGKDCYKVGKSLGAGASAVVMDGKLVYPATNYRSYRILKQSDTKVVFVLSYPEWETDGEKISLEKKITLEAGTHFARVDDTYRFSGKHGKKLQVAAGVVRHTKKNTVIDELEGGDRYALWEKASDTKAEPEDGKIGVAVYVPGAESCGLTADRKHGIVTKTVSSGRTFTYYFGSCWSKGDVPSAEDWFRIVKGL